MTGPDTYSATGDEDIPNPISGGPGTDLRARHGELTPMENRLRAAYPGVVVGGLHAVAIGNAATVLPRSDSAGSAVIQVQTAPIRFTVDGAMPTATAGVRADPGAIIVITGPQDLRSFQAIREGAVDAVLSVSYYA